MARIRFNYGLTVRSVRGSMLDPLINDQFGFDFVGARYSNVQMPLSERLSQNRAYSFWLTVLNTVYS